MKKMLCIGVVFLAVGVFAGYALRWALEVPPEVDIDLSEIASKPSGGDAGEDAVIRNLRMRLAELERKLAEAGRKLAAQPTQQVAKAEWKRPGPGDFRKHIEKMKLEDPKRYAEMTNRFARMRARQSDRALNRLEFLSSIDVGRLGARATKVHRDLQKAIATKEELEEQMGDENLTDAEREDIMQQLREVDHQSRGLAREERENLLKMTATTLGLSDDDSAALAETIREVIDATDSHGGHGGPGGPPPDGGASGAGAPPAM